MSSELALRVDGVSKAFAIYEKPHHRLLQQLFPNAGRSWHREFHALRNIDFEVYRGETVGIVGRNGSGKSTLLQIICGTLAPSAGKVQVYGRIAALLELGAGFNPEFSGRENVYLNATVLGLTRAEIDASFADIAAFADIGEFMEQPVKSYSSGMYVRLAFAVAINVKPDILIVDEALAVGDEAFQRKCHARLDRLRDDGATILFVSHSAGMVIELCNRAVLLDRGEMLALGTPRHVVSRYHKLLFAPASKLDEVRARIRAEADSGPVAAGSGAAAAGNDEASDGSYFDPSLVSQSILSYPSLGACIDDPHIETSAGQRVNMLRGGSDYVYVYRVHFDTAAAGVRCGMMFRTTTGLDLAGGASALAGEGLDVVEAGQSISVRFQFRCLLAPGTYFANAGVLGLHGESEQYLDRRIDAIMFRVLPDLERLSTGMVDLCIGASVSFDPQTESANV
ncbi:lipopolysaccharide transport system ATP-binding protein [Tahibacter aquaticus]|uniref:Lipopolysaccharide transport system ATP-binding protein n=1 Tax=Tahibacter aquaticus TaxID=520092 RepID=A0A4R6ZAP0_9GAMM|nr:ABC transporter ATP-binding protein [Tahibacter aquaticus]TDR48824.1 lipopolysaccharide transport system ATP-binding protein [Tahibacter aquaticus]